MLRIVLLSLLTTGLVQPAHGATRVTVAQLEQSLAALHSQPDAKAAPQILTLELTERLSASRLTHDLADLPGPIARQALTAVSDASQFLDLPPSDIPSTAAPDAATQRALWASTLNFASKTIARLPNFYATRDTRRFQDTPAESPRDQTYTAHHEPLHQVGESSETVLYRDGHEFVDAAGKQHKDFKQSDYALSTAGEFGPILATVLADSSHGRAPDGGIYWSHWEQGTAGPISVYRYAVPQQESHYTVNFPGPDGDTPLLPAYHGEIGVNPDDGSILRLTMVADFKPTDPVSKAGLLVEYGPVEIGGTTYICPLRSVALSLGWQVRVTANSMYGTTASRGPLQTRVNDVTFKNYHLFRAELRILSGDPPDPPAPAPAVSPAAPPNP